MNRMEVSGWKTAQKRRRTSAPLRWLEQRGFVANDLSVLDFGCGRDVHNYWKYDPYWAPDWLVLCYQYDVVTCNYVLNVIESVEARKNVVATVRNLTDRRGVACFSIWRKQRRDTRSCKGFQSGWSKDQWTGFFCEQPGWEVVQVLPSSPLWMWALYPEDD